MAYLKNSNRLSNIDLIKIFAIFIIIISHIIPFNYANFGDEYININFATDELVQIVIQFFRYLGQIGNTIFIISSSWFLLEKTTINKKKVIYILLDCWFISILILIIFIFRKYNLNFKIIIKNLLPTTFGNNWFIANYLIFYLIAPFLNKIINNCEKKN